MSIENDKIEYGIASDLDKLAELKAQQDALRLEKQALIDNVLTPEIRQAIAEIEAEYAERETTCSERITEATEKVKEAVVTYGKTVRAQRLMAVWCKGRDSWDSDKLFHLAKRYAEVWDAHTEGKPSVSIRTV